MIAEHAMKWDVLVIMDEVYQWMVFEERQHIRMGKASL